MGKQGPLKPKAAKAAAKGRSSGGGVPALTLGVVAVVGIALAAAANHYLNYEDPYRFGGWPLPPAETFTFSDGHSAQIVALAEEPMLQLVRGILSPDEVAELQQLFRDNLHAAQDKSKPGEVNATLMWTPSTDATTGLPVDSPAMNSLNQRLVELCDKARIDEPAFTLEQLEAGYFSSYNKPIDTPIWGLHNDNHARMMAENPRLLSMVIHLNDAPRNALTVFPLARRLGLSAMARDPTDALMKHIYDERPPPRNAAPGSMPEPWWRFITRQFDHDYFNRLPESQRSEAATLASRIYTRANDICKAGAWDGLRPQPGDAAFFRSGTIKGGPEARAMHASCGDTGPKVVLAKFVRQYDLTSTQRANA